MSEPFPIRFGIPPVVKRGNSQLSVNGRALFQGMNGTESQHMPEFDADAGNYHAGQCFWNLWR